PEIKRHLLLRLARLQQTELGDAERAEDSYLRALAIEQRNPEALAALDRMYDASQKWSELAEILTQRIAGTTASEEIIELHFRLGRLYAEILEEPEKAVAAYTAILDVDSRNAQALEALERIYFTQQDWAALFGVYEKMVDIVPGDDGMAECY